MAVLKKTDEGTGVAQPSELVRTAMAQELAQRLVAATAQRDTLSDALAEARIVAEPAHRLRMMAEDTWELNGGDDGNHTVQEAQRLEQRRAEDVSAAQRIADLERQIGDVEGEIATLQQSDAREQAQALVAQVWTPTVHALVGPVRALIPALREQRAVLERFYAEGVTGIIDRDTELALYGAGFSDDLLPELERWLAVAEHSGLADGKVK